MEELFVMPESTEHAGQDLFDLLICEALTGIASTEVFFLNVGGVVAVENQVEFLLVRTVSAVVEQEVLVELGNRVAFRSFVQCDIALRSR